MLNGRTLQQSVLDRCKVLQFLHRIASAQSPNVEHQQIGISDRILIREPSPPRQLAVDLFEIAIECLSTRVKSIADEVGALTMADVSHYGGLVAANVMRNPLDAGFDVMTTTSHKTLRGPRGGIILCRKENAGRIDASVFPGLQGGPHMNVVAGIAVTLKKAATSDFQAYAWQVLRNAKVLAGALMESGMKLVTDGRTIT